MEITFGLIHPLRHAGLDPASHPYRHAGLDPASPSIITNNYTKTYMCNKSKSNSFSNDNLVKQVTYLIGNEIAQGNHTPITPEFVAAALHISLSEAEAALKVATEVISGK